jgi:hypothetical protein
MEDQKISELDYFEVQVQLQILEHIADKGPLSKGNRDLVRELEEREKALIREKSAQPFREGETAAADKVDWEAATKLPEFGKTADALALRHLQDDVELIDKHKEDARKFGPSKGLEDMHSQEREIHARHFDEERGRYAREFLEQRKLLEELEQKESGLEKDKGHDFSH